MKKRLISMALVLIMVLGLFPVSALAVSVEDFTDLKTDAWYYDYIDFVVEEGYFNGMSETEFGPKTEMTRAMFVTVIARVEGAEIDNSVESSFPDCKSNTWYTGSVEWAAENGIVTGYEDGNFRPHGNVTRQEMCTIMDRYIAWRSEKTGEEHVTDGENIVFTDAADIANFAKEAVQNCVAYGLVEGYPDGTFLPRNNSTRAEVAAVICRLDWIVHETPDNPSNPDRPNPPTPPTPDDPDDPVDPDEPTDYIYKAVNGALEDIADLAKDGMVEANKLSNEYKDYVSSLNEKYGAIDFGDYLTADYKVGDIAGAKRPVTVEAGIELDGDAARNIINFVVGCAFMLFGDTEDVTWGEINDVVDAVKDDLERFGFTPVDDIDAAMISEVIFDHIQDEDNIWTDNFKGAEGFYTGDIKISCRNFSATVTVNDNGIYIDNWRDKAEDLAVALAEELCDDIDSKATDYVYEMYDIEAVVDVTFSAGAYAEDTDNFPYNYPITFNVDVASDLDILQYKYDGYNHFKLYFSEEIQDEIQNATDDIADRIMESKAVKDEVSEGIDAALTSDQFQQLLNVLYRTKMTEAEADKVVEEYLDLWIADNVESIMADEGWTNEYIYALGGVIGQMVSEYLEDAYKTAIELGVVKKADMTPEGVAKTFAKLENYGIKGFNLDGIDSRVKNYVFAAICDYVTGVDKYEAKYMPAMKEYVDTTVDDAIDGNKNVQDALEYGGYLRDILHDMSILEDIEFGELADALRIDFMQEYVDSKDDESIVKELCSYLNKIPKDASVTIAGVKIDRALLTDLRKAETAAEACEALADIIDIPAIAELTIGSFAPKAGQDILISYDGETYKVNLAIEIQ